MIEKLLLKLISKERLIAHVLSFILGASAAALGANVDAVKQQFCKDVVSVDLQGN